MYEDSPEELVHDILSECAWERNSLGFPILGTSDSLSGIERDEIMSYMKKNYLPQNTVIAVAGNFAEDKMVSLIKDRFSTWKVRKYTGKCGSGFTAGIKIRKRI